MNVHRLSHIAAAIAAIAPALPGFAAEDAPQQLESTAAPMQDQRPAVTQPATLQRVIVTGSNIKRIDIETSDPVAVLTRVDIERSGASTLAGFLQSLPWTTPSLTDLNGETSFAPGATSTSLRHLDQQSTLVLLNGRRVAPFALADFAQYFTNIDTLPLAAVERIEILKNGASAVYGSDAVAGVVNIITRQDFQGVEAGVDLEQSLNARPFADRGFNVTAGFGKLKADGFNVTGTLQYYHRDPVMWRDVMHRASPAWASVLPQGDDQLSSFSTPGNIASPSVGWHALAGCAPELVKDGVCWYDRYKHFQAQPAADRANLLVSAKVALNADIEGFAEVLWARTKTSYRSAKAYYDSEDPADVWANPGTGMPETFARFWLPPTHPLNDTGEYAAMRMRFDDVEAGVRASASTYRLTTGLRGAVGGYDWETSLSLLGSKATQAYRGNISKSGFQKTIGGTTDLSNRNSAVDPNFFNMPNGYRLGQHNSDAVLDVLFPSHGTDGKLTQTALDGKVSGEIAMLPAGPLSFAAGYDLRHERSAITPSAHEQSGDIVGLASAQTDASRTFGAVFGELDVPVVDTLNAQVAARIDKFPGFGAHLSPKLGLRLQPTKDLLLRATAESGFRAPNLVEAGKSTKSSYSSGSEDPARCGGARRYAADLRAQAAALPADDFNRAELLLSADRALTSECSGGAVDIARHNPDLKPELSRGFSLGLLFEPVQHTSLTLDYWSLKRRNEIRVANASEVLQREGELPSGIVQRAPLSDDAVFTTAALQQQYDIKVGKLLSVERRFENVSRTRTDGIDFGAKTRVGTPVGELELNLLGTWLNRFQTYYADRGYGDNMAGRYGYSRLSANLSGALTTGAFVNGVKLVYYSGTKLQGDYADTAWSEQGCAEQQIAARDCRVGAYVRTDYFFSYSGIRNLTISAHVRNVFNRGMALDRRALWDNSVTPPPEDAQRRSLAVSATYRF
jgi:iron complex outermembrane recepter protein